MSTFRRLTLIGLYNHRPDLFDKLVLPADYDRDTFIDTVLLDHGEKRVTYPEPEFFKYAVGVWSRKWSESLERIARALTTEYNPLHNYDRYEKWTDHSEGDYKNNVKQGGADTTRENEQTEGTDTGTVERENTGTVTTTNAGTVTTKESGTTTESTNNMTTEKTVSAFNETTYQPDEKSVVNGSVVTTPDTTQVVTPDTTETETRNLHDDELRNLTDTRETNRSGETKYGKTEDGSGDDRRDTVHDGHLYGNIGVTTSQSMATDEVNLRRDFNMYAVAAGLFADDLLLMLY